MDFDYDKVRSVSFDQFQKEKDRFRQEDFIFSDADDIRKMEEYLSLRPGILADQEFSFQKTECSCGRRLTFFDFVYSAVEKWAHPKSFVVHTLIGSKFILNEPRPVACSSCGNDVGAFATYSSDRYGCCFPGR